MATIREVAERAGVSPATAARVLGAYGYSSEESRKKVQAAAQELNYHPDQVARSLATGRTSVIGLVVADIENPFFAEIARGVADVAAAHGLTIILANTDEDQAKQREAIKVLLGMRVVGLIIAPASSRYQPDLAGLHERGFPIVLVDRRVEGVQLDSVLAMNAEGAEEAVTYLLDLGHRGIGVVSDSPEITTNAERLEGYRRAHGRAGLQVDEALVRVAQYTRAAAQREARALLESPNRPTALFGTGNFMTIGCLLAARDLGLSIPRDVALVGFDDMDWATIIRPQLTTVAQPTRLMGRAGAEQLVARLGGDGSPAREIRLPVQFHVRESCAPPAKADGQR